MPKLKKTHDFYVSVLAELPSGARPSHIPEFPIRGPQHPVCVDSGGAVIGTTPHTICVEAEIVHNLRGARDSVQHDGDPGLFTTCVGPRKV